MHFSNYRDFYQYCLLPVSDKALIHTDPNVSHWLIALEGHRSSEKEESYFWKVVIFETNEDGYFQNKEPYYTSSSYNNFHRACDAATKLKQTITNDGFHFPSPQLS